MLFGVYQCLSLQNYKRPKKFIQGRLGALSDRGGGSASEETLQTRMIIKNVGGDGHRNFLYTIGDCVR